MSLNLLLAVVMSGQVTTPAGTPSSAPEFTVIRIEVPADAIDVRLTDLNNRGEVALNYYVSSHCQAHLWTNGKSVALKGFTETGCRVDRINDFGLAVGRARDSNGTWVAASWTLGKSAALEDWKSVAPFALSKSDSQGTAIDEAGNIAIYEEGFSRIVGPAGKRNLDGLGRLLITVLGPDMTFGGYTHWRFDKGFGHFGEVAGKNAFNGSGTRITKFPRTDFEESEVTAGNSTRQYVGCFAPEKKQPHACIWNGSNRTDLNLAGWVNSVATGINDQGDVVGNFKTEKTAFPGSAFLYRDGKMYDLNDCIPALKSARLGNAIDINNRGEILCEGFQDVGPKVFLLLVPLAKGG